MGLQVGNRLLHRLGALQHERQLHLPRTEELTDGLHASQQVVVDDLQRGLDRERLVQIGIQSPVVAVHDAPRETLRQRQRLQLGLALLAQGSGGHPLEQVEELRQRIVVVGAPVVDQIKGGLVLLVGDPVSRHDLGDADDGRVQTGLHTLVQEDAVQHHPRRRIEPETDVRDPERGQDTRMPGLQLADRLDGGQAIAAGLLSASGDREREGVDQDVALVHPPLPGQRVDQPLGDPHLPLSGACLALLVDRQRHHRRAMLGHQRHHSLEAGAGPLAVLEVDRVDDGPARQMVQAGLNDLGLRGVQHHRQGHGVTEPRGELRHVGHAVASDIVDTQIQDVRAGTRLVASDPHAVIPAPFEHRLPEGLGPVRVRALTDRQVAGVLFERHF